MAEPRPLFPREPKREPAKSEKKRAASDRGEEAQPTESLSDLASELVADVGSLLRSELQLARTEIRQEVSALIWGTALLASGGAVLFLGVLYLLLAATFAIGYALPLSSSALIVGAVVFVVGAILAAIGAGKLSMAKPVPEQTIESLREDVRWLRNKKP